MRPERLAVIGDPIAHSLSPSMHNAALQAAGLHWVYEARHVHAADLRKTVEEFRDLAYRGFNVTIPHKVAIGVLLDEIDDAARAVGAVNTVIASANRLVGHNTDPGGFRGALRSLDFDPTGARVVLFGAGGAARAVVEALRADVQSIVVVNRNRARADDLVSHAGVRVTGVAPDDTSVLNCLARAHLVVNATPLGMEHLPDGSPLPSGARFRPGALAMDLIYGRVTPFLADARRGGCCTSDGLEMLVQQGAAAFRMWTGVPANLSAMRDACRHRMELQPC